MIRDERILQTYLDHANQCGPVVSAPYSSTLSVTGLRRDGPDLAQHLIFGFLIFWECPSDLISAASIAPGRCLERVLIP